MLERGLGTPAPQGRAQGPSLVTAKGPERCPQMTGHPAATGEVKLLPTGVKPGLELEHWALPTHPVSFH